MHVTELIEKLQSYGADVSAETIDGITTAIALDIDIKNEILRRANNRYASGRELGHDGNPLPAGFSVLNLPKTASTDDILDAIKNYKETPLYARFGERERRDYQKLFDEVMEYRRGQRNSDGAA